jgi:hypothetical protein
LIERLVLVFAANHEAGCDRVAHTEIGCLPALWPGRAPNAIRRFLCDAEG